MKPSHTQISSHYQQNLLFSMDYYTLTYRAWPVIRGLILGGVKIRE